MFDKIKPIVIIFCLLLVGATCTEQEAQQVLASGTDYIFEEREKVDLVLVLDRSGSMRGEKIRQAKSAAIGMIEQLARGDRAAVIGFDTNPRVYSEFKTNKDEIISAVNSIEVGDYTRYNGALQRASDMFNGNKKVIVFLSDGKPDDDQQELFQIVSNIVNQGVCIFTIAYADSIEEEAQLLLGTIAETSRGTGQCGEYFRAGESAFELEKIFKQIYTEVSSEQLIEPHAEINIEQNATFDISAKSILNNRDLYDETCFNPEINLVLTKNGEVIQDVTTADQLISLQLGPGEYEYHLNMKETCGGECLFTGTYTGTFQMQATQNSCFTPWEELGVLLTNNEYVEIQITENGFSPQTIGTEGVVIWRNIDTKSHKISGLNLDFESPTLEPGDTWSYVFPPGVYTYKDEDATISGLFRNEKVTAHDPVDLVLIMDKSGSMAGPPLDSAKEAAKNLVSIMSPVDRASLIVFSDKARTVQFLTSDTRLLDNSVDSVKSEGSTFYIPALNLAGTEIRKSSTSRKQAIIFLSDGAPSEEESKAEILASLDANLEDACLYSIGYGEQGVAAIDLLTTMAEHVQQQNQCGLFYFSKAEKEELSEVFGEIYANTQRNGLEIFDITIPEKPKKTFEMTLRVRSKDNGINVPSTFEYGCIPPADVYIDINGERFEFKYQGDTYRADITLPPGTYNGIILAKLSPANDPIHVTLGSTKVTVQMPGFKWWIWVLVLAVLFGLIAKLLMNKLRGLA